MPRLASLFIFAALAAVALPAAQAQPYPSRPLRLLVGFAAGGGADALARMTATHVGEALGQQVVVENRAGAGGTLAADAVAKAQPDGYTLLFGETGLLIAPALYANLPFDPVKGFAAVGGVATLPLVIVVNPNLPAKNTAELIAHARANPGKLSYASPGIGTVHHLAMELLRKQAGLDYVHVPYKGASAILPDLIGGQVPVAIVSAPPALAQAKAGKLRAIALTSPVKLAGAPDWPALADTLPGFDASPRTFVLAPAGTPAALIARLDAALRATLAKPAVLEALNAQGAIPTPAGAEELGAQIAAESRKWGAVARESGAKAQ